MKQTPVFLLLFLVISPLYAANSLLYVEAEGVAGYQRSDMDDGFVYRSGHPDDVMQLNSVGIDFIKKISTGTGDIGTVAFQARLAYNKDRNRFEPQVYNAYLKAKTQYVDIWGGHERVAFGLSSFWDTHGDLLQPLPMYGFGFDRDWGTGIVKDTDHGDFKIALTTGTGMGIRANGNWLVTSRASYGVLSYDNYNIGVSGMAGQKPDVVGYKIMDNRQVIVSEHMGHGNSSYEVIDKRLKETALFGLDFSFNTGRFEHKTEFNIGEKDKKRALAGFYRLALNFLEENRLKIEGQYVYTEQEKTRDHALGAGITFKLNAWLTSRIMYEWQKEMKEHKLIAQLYLYYLAL